MKDNHKLITKRSLRKTNQVVWDFTGLQEKKRHFWT